MQKCALQGKEQNILRAAKREFTKVTQRCVEGNVKKSKLSSYIFKFGFGGLGITAVYIKSNNQTVICREAKEISDIKSDNPELIFEWSKFFKYLYPHVWYLLLALSVSICDF